MSTTLTAIAIRRLLPPQDSFWQALLEANLTLQNGDVLVLSSKAVAIDEGRCVLKEGTDKSALVHQQAEAYLPAHLNPYGFELALVHHALIAAAGVDASNCGDYFTLLPANPFASARAWHSRLCAHFGLTDLGVVIADSHALPLRWGAQDISIGFWGFNPLKDYRGTPDLFNNVLQVSQGNLVDAMAAAAGGLMGQGVELTPAVRISGWPNLQFDATQDYQAAFFISPEEDLFTLLLDVFKTQGVVGEKGQKGPC